MNINNTKGTKMQTSTISNTTNTVSNGTKADRLLSALKSEHAQVNGMTSRQISARFKVLSPRDLIHRLRKNGHTITLEETITTKGKSRQKYFLDDWMADD